MKREFCLRGHRLEEGNLIGNRECRKCKAARERGDIPPIRHYRKKGRKSPEEIDREAIAWLESHR